MVPPPMARMHSPPDYQDNNNFALSGKIMLSAIVILFAVVVLMICLHIYARWYLLRTRHRQRLRRRGRRRTHLIFYVEPDAPAAASRGLDASVLSSLPVFVYSAAAHPEAPECAVCLCEFEENEKARLLPKCNHSFHTECIDMWFHSHSTCPLCRSPVEAVPEHCSDVVVSVGEPDGAEAASSSGPCAACRHQEDVSLASSSSLADRRKAFEPANVRIDVPSRAELVDESGLSSPASHGTKSPASRLLSLRRILSLNRKGPAVSPSSELGTSCGGATAELETESGGHESSRHQTPR